MNLLMKNSIRLLAGSAGVLSVWSASVDLPRLELKQGHFTNSSGVQERFWGMNLVSAFPTHEESDALADNLASLGVNLVRPHHLMRQSKDWVWRAPCAALMKYETDSRTPDPEAWDRFDYLNAALRKRNIRLVLSLHYSRKFLPGDAAIDPSGDAAAWADAVGELNNWSWQKAIDPVKLLPVIDRRARLVQKEFAQTLLNHRNPYTGKTYGEDAQVLYLELLNESSLEYALICNNTFPDYFERELQAAWTSFAQKAGLENPGNFRQAKDKNTLRIRAQFFRSFEDDYFRDMRAFLRGLGSQVPVTCVNLWRGNDVLAANAEIGDVIEDHLYVDSLVVREAGDWLDMMARTRVDGKPHIIGEFNHTENQDLARRDAYARPMLMLSAAAYGAFLGLDGFVWFAYNHGDRNLASDGWSKAEQRVPSLGDMASDGVMLDHLATCSALFRSGLLKPSIHPQQREITVPVNASNYNELMADAQIPPAGALSVHAYSKHFSRGAAASAAPAVADVSANEGEFVSDTGEIVRDIQKKQLSVSAAGAEAFSGFLSAGFPARFSHLQCTETNGFATIISVSLDGKLLSESGRIIISRTWMDEAGIDKPGLGVVMKDLRKSASGGWSMLVRRPRLAGAVLRDLAGLDTVPLKQGTDGTVTLPRGTWTQVELIWSEK